MVAIDVFTLKIREKELESRYKTNCDFETPTPQNIDGVGRKYIHRIGLRRFATPPNTEYIFSQLAVNILWCWRLKIAISL